MEAAIKEIKVIQPLLPSGVIRANKNENPRLMVLYGDPKAGKSTLCAMIPGALIIDLAEEYKYIDAMKVKISSIEKLFQLGKEIRNSERKFPVIVIDNASLFYELVKPYGLSLYKDTAKGRYYQGSVEDIPFGGAWYWPRMAFMKVLEGFLGLCKSLVLVGHMKTGSGEDGTGDASMMTLDLPGLLRNVVLGAADTVGRLYRSRRQNILDLDGGGNALAQSRVPKLRGRQIVLGEADEKGMIKHNWNEVFE